MYCIKYVLLDFFNTVNYAEIQLIVKLLIGLTHPEIKYTCQNCFYKQFYFINL